MMTKPIEHLHRMAKHIEMWLVDKLIPWARNPRTHSDAQVAQIAASIAAFGFNNPILVDTQAGIIAGHAWRVCCHDAMCGRDCGGAITHTFVSECSG